MIIHLDHLDYHTPHPARLHPVSFVLVDSLELSQGLSYISLKNESVIAERDLGSLLARSSVAK